jgi:uncharacterized membrane protein YdbT with pleckstrin-like domain
LVWKGKPSQWLNFFKFILIGFILYGCIFKLHVGDPLYNFKPYFIGAFSFWGLWSFLVVYCISYEITNERIIVRRGVLSRITQNLEIFRVKDVRLDQPFFLRLVSRSTIFMVTSDQTTRFLRLTAIKNGRFIHEKIRELSEQRREIKGVKEFDMSHLFAYGNA